MERLIREIAFKSAKNFVQKEWIIKQWFREFKDLIQKMRLTIDNIKNKKSLIFSDDFKIMYYLFQAFYGDMAKIILVLLIGLIFGMFLECVIVILAFAGLRSLAGGYHATTYESCFIMTVSIYVIGGIISKTLLTNIDNYNIILITTTTLVLLINLLYAPRFMLEVTENKRKRFKKYSVIYVLVCYGLTFVLSKYLYVPIFVGIILQALLVTPIAYKFFGWIDETI